MGGIYFTALSDVAKTAVLGTPYQVILVDGWQTRGHGGFRALEGVVGHHTGTAQSAPGDYPTLRVVRDGRSDLLGPLCNYGIGRSGAVYCVAAGVAWHAGASAYAGMVDLNDEFLGIEAESAGGGLWTPQQMDVYPRLVRAILDFIKRPVTRYASHRTVATPRGRKTDPTGIDDAWMQNAAASAHGAVVGPNTPVVVPTSGTAAEKEIDPVSDIPITMFSDGQFRGGVMCEVGDGSAVIARGYITAGLLWGGQASMTITFLAKGGPIGQIKDFALKNNADAGWEIPSGTRMITVEGKASSPNVTIAASRVLVPR